tara:strand:+ start:347 stop:799 length:453 start_codon:yes stop_codon:yes gene_type:complete
MKKIFILLLFIVNACGYQPIYKVNKIPNDIKIQEVELTGNKNISNQIFSKLPFIIDKNNKLLEKIFIDSNKNIIEASKDSKGQVTSYKIILSVKYKKLNKDNIIVEERDFKKEFSYNSDNNKFNLKEHELKFERNLIDRIVEDIIIHLTY